jgi:hypothetical protein
LEQRVFPEAPVRHWICSLPFQIARQYRVPNGVLRPGRNVIVVRVFDHT